MFLSTARSTRGTTSLAAALFLIAALFAAAVPNVWAQSGSGTRTAESDGDRSAARQQIERRVTSMIETWDTMSPRGSVVNELQGMLERYQATYVGKVGDDAEWLAGQIGKLTKLASSRSAENFLQLKAMLLRLAKADIFTGVEALIANNTLQPSLEFDPGDNETAQSYKLELLQAFEGVLLVRGAATSRAVITQRFSDSLATAEDRLMKSEYLRATVISGESREVRAWSHDFVRARLDAYPEFDDLGANGDLFELVNAPEENSQQMDRGTAWLLLTRIAEMGRLSEHFDGEWLPAENQLARLLVEGRLDSIVGNDAAFAREARYHYSLQRQGLKVLGALISRKGELPVDRAAAKTKLSGLWRQWTRGADSHRFSKNEGQTAREIARAFVRIVETSIVLMPTALELKEGDTSRQTAAKAKAAGLLRNGSGMLEVCTLVMIEEFSMHWASFTTLVNAVANEEVLQMLLRAVGSRFPAGTWQREFVDTQLLVHARAGIPEEGSVSVDDAFKAAMAYRIDRLSDAPLTLDLLQAAPVPVVTLESNGTYALQRAMTEIMRSAEFRGAYGLPGGTKALAPIVEFRAAGK